MTSNTAEAGFVDKIPIPREDVSMMSPILFTLVVSTVADPTEYAHPKILLEPAVAVKTDHAFHYLDIRSEGAFKSGHIPRAVHGQMGKWSKAVNEGKADAAFWKDALQAVGVTPDVPTVVYGTDVKEVCRAWWLLKYAGVSDVRVLNGGIDGYIAAGGKLATEPIKYAVKPYDWKPEAGRLALKSDVLTSVKDKASQIIDSRSAGEFSGAEALAKKGGRVPGAKPLEWVDFIDAKTKRFKPARELSKIIADRQIDLTKRCTTYCQSGGRASVVAFGLELMGARDVCNYYRSWSEWGNAEDTPVEK
jgi:thiosulfate/3-mercaptopyruvate sulfurtransferase